MQTAAPRPTGRLTFLDNVRYLMVLVVVVFHVSAGYSGYSEFYQEPEGGGAFAVVRNVVSAVPTMQLLFFVAGYFALPSLRRRSAGAFVGHKLRQLGLPWLVCVLLLGPLMPFLGFYSQSFVGLQSDSYLDFWRRFLASGFNGWVIPVSFTTNARYHQMHYWFVSVLLQFFCLLAGARALWSRWGKAARLPVRLGVRMPSSVTAELLVAGVAMAAVRAVGNLVHLPFGTSLLFFHELGSSLFQHGPFFALGAYAWRRGWFVTRPCPGLACFGILLGALVGLGGIGFGLYAVWGDHGPQPVYAVIGALFETLLVLWFLVIVVGLTHRFMNRPSPLNAMLAANSFVVYLIHYPLILVFRLWLLPWDAPALAKWPLVLAVVLVSSHLLSHFLIRPRPRLSSGLLVGLTATLWIFGLPRFADSHLLLDRRSELVSVVPDAQPARLTDLAPVDVDAWTRASPSVRATWQAGALYAAAQPGGLKRLTSEGVLETLADSLQLASIAPGPGACWRSAPAASGWPSW